MSVGFETAEAMRAPGAGWRRTPLWLRLLGATRDQYRDGPRDRSHRMRWGELVVGWQGLAFKLGAHETAHLHLALLFIGAFIRLPFLDRLMTANDRCGMDNPAFGFSTFGASLHLSWGRAVKIIDPPWQARYVFREFLDVYGRWSPHERIWREYEPTGIKAATQELPYHYLLDDGEVQHVTATVHRERGWIVWKWFGESTSPYAMLGAANGRLANGRRIRKAWVSDFLRAMQKRFSKPRQYIEIAFSGEVGSRAGSWKGGCIGCSFEMRPGEDVRAALLRMQRTRRFR